MQVRICSLLLCALCGCLTGVAFCAGEDFESYASFQRAMTDQDDLAALEAGDKLFNQLAAEHRADAGFGALRSKLMASEFLSQQMIQQLQKATGSQMQLVTGQLLGKSSDQSRKKGKQDALAVAPAKSFYETSTDTFLKTIDVSNLSEQEMGFLKQYYNVKLRKYTTDVAKAGQALTIARPDFKDTHHYVLVLPLLHFIEPQEVPLDVLPKWMTTSRQLSEFSDSCLLHYGLGYHAMSFARKASKLENRSFSELQFYQSAVEKTKKNAAYVAVDCMKHAEKLVGNSPEKQVAIRRQIIQVWLDSGNYDLAASEAKSFIVSFGTYSASQEVYWLYFYALSRANRSETILNEIDDALDNPQCQPYRSKMLYLKWWALRRQRDQAPRVAALEHELLKLYGNNPMVAPIMLSRATDLLAGQDYNGAYEMLSQLNEKFPDTQAAQQAKRILEKLKTLVNRG